MLQIRRMLPSDIQFAIRLTDQEEWGVTRADFKRLMRLNPRGCFIAFDGKTRLGLTTTTVYGKQLAWIGNVIVDKSHRGERIGHSLVRHALSVLQRADVKRIALYCFKEHKSFYEGLGFVENKSFLRLKREARANRLESRVEFEHSLSLSELIAADTKAFGADRSKLIRAVLADKVAWYLGSSDKNSRTSYLMAKDYGKYCELGPWVCVGGLRDAPSQMIARALTITGRVPVEVSCLQENKIALEALKANGFRKVREGYRMSFGRRVRIGDDRSQFALGFLDKG
jgi:ribosomal protein S18 acetylase RimI-like enzyme